MGRYETPEPANPTMPAGPRARNTIASRATARLVEEVRYRKKLKLQLMQEQRWPERTIQASTHAHMTRRRDG